jgi:hypothetical protein
MSNEEFTFRDDTEFMIIYWWQAPGEKEYRTFIPCANQKDVQDQVSRCLKSDYFTRAEIIRNPNAIAARPFSPIEEAPPTIRDLSCIPFTQDHGRVPETA